MILEKKIVTVEIEPEYKGLVDRSYEIIEMIEKARIKISELKRDGEGIETVRPLLRAIEHLNDAVEDVSLFRKNVYDNRTTTKEEIIKIF